MRVLLPPSETKRDGGIATPVALDNVSFSSLTPLRHRLVDAVVALAGAPEECMRVLKLGPKLAFEVDRNASLRSSPTMPAIDRYTGVLFDALDAESLRGQPRNDLLSHVKIQSALWGPISAADMIPAYRLSCTSRVPGITAPFTKLWGDATSDLSDLWSGFTLDMRSEGYAALTPRPPDADAVFVRVVTREPGGQVTALNHFNKASKGQLVRSLCETGGVRAIASQEDLLVWASEHGWTMEPSQAGEVTLVV